MGDCNGQDGAGGRTRPNGDQSDRSPLGRVRSSVTARWTGGRPGLLLAAVALLASGLVVATGGAARAADGSFDPRFGDHGVATTTLPIGADTLSHVVVDGSGRLVVVGVGQVLDPVDLLPGVDPTSDAFAARLLADGSLDPSFGDHGRVRALSGLRSGHLFDPGVAMVPSGLALGPAGTIVVGGGSGSRPDGLQTDQATVVRLLDNGAYDPTWGSGGRQVITGLPDGRHFLGLLGTGVTPLGRVLVALPTVDPSHQTWEPAYRSGTAVLRLLPTGAVDPTFATNGEAFVPAADGAFRVAAFGPDGSTLLGGSAPGQNGVPAVARLTAAGALDSSWGVGGVATEPPPPGAPPVTVGALGRGPDGSVTLAGDSGLQGFSDTMSVARLTPSGQPDPGFGPSGYANIAPGALQDERPGGLVVTPDGSVTVLGLGGAYPSFEYGSLADTLMLRVHRDGTLDPTFGTAGRVSLPHTDAANALVVLADGRPVSVGGTGDDSRALRLATTGQLDPSFGDGGLVTFNAGTNGDATVGGAALTADGHLLVGGGGDGGITVAELTASGAIDANFGDGGVAKLLLDGTPVINDVAVGANGDVVVVGNRIDDGFPAGLVVARFHADGRLDRTFGAGGLVTHLRAMPYDCDSGTSVALDAAGDIVVAGCRVAGGESRVMVERLLPTGQPDPTFGGGTGVVTSDAGNALAVVLEPDGSIVVGGDGPDTANPGALHRYLHDGSVDPTFQPSLPYISGGAGLTPPMSRVQALARQGDGRLLVAGRQTGYPERYGVLRLDSQGLPDPTFAAGGVAISRGDVADPSGFSSLALQPDGDVLTSYPHFWGSSSQPNVVVRIDPFGNLDETFGPNGESSLQPNGVGAGVSGSVMPIVLVDHQNGVLAVGRGPFGLPHLKVARYRGLDRSYAPPPTVTSTTTGCQNGRVLVTAAGYDLAGATKVRIVGTYMDEEVPFTVDSDTQLHFVVPSDVSSWYGADNVVVHNAAGDSDRNQWSSFDPTNRCPVPHADPSVSSDVAAHAQVGETVTFHLHASNAGPQTAGGVVVTDTFQSGATVMSVDASAGSCSPTSSIDVRCDLGDMASGASVDIDEHVRVDSAGSVSDEAEVFGYADDANRNDDYASATVDVSPESTTTTTTGGGGGGGGGGSGGGGGDGGGTTTTSTTSTTAPAGAAIVRVAGPTRYDTAVALSGATWRDHGAQSAVVVRGDTFVDALSATPLAVSRHGPLLLTDASALSASTAAELDRVLPPGAPVYLVGGEAALSPAVAKAIADRGYEVRRISGPDRFGTAVNVAHALGDPNRVVETTGLDFPDALSAGALAAHQGGAVLLTNGSQPANATTDYLVTHPTAQRTAVGGPAAAADPLAASVVGHDRFDTSVRVASTYFPSARSAVVASGVAFPDGLTGGGFAAARDGPLVLSAPAYLPTTVASWLHGDRAGLATVTLSGGTAALSDTVRDEIRSAVD